MKRRLPLLGFLVLPLIACAADDDDEHQDVASSTAEQNTNFFDTAMPGSNGRSCETCHLAQDGWGLAARSVQNTVFSAGFGHPVFRNVDANRTYGDDGTRDPASAYRWLVERGVFRVNLPSPGASADFTFDGVGPATAKWADAPNLQVAVFRRPLPTTNLKFQRVFMWDGRETVRSPDPEIQLETSLRQQAFDATKGHAEAPWFDPSAPNVAVSVANIVAFERSLASDAVLRDFCFANAGTFQCRQTGRFLAPGAGFDLPLAPNAARGRDIFMSRTFPITNVRVAGIDGTSFTMNQVGTCATCHDGRNVGSNVEGWLMDIGISEREAQDLQRPVYVFTKKGTGEKVQTTDPGRALVTGRWSDMNCFKVPSLREATKRAPYFHDGSSATIDDVLTHYQRRFGLALTPQDRADLSAFLFAL